MGTEDVREGGRMESDGRVGRAGAEDTFYVKTHFLEVLDHCGLSRCSLVWYSRLTDWHVTRKKH